MKKMNEEKDEIIEFDSSYIREINTLNDGLGMKTELSVILSYYPNSFKMYDACSDDIINHDQKITFYVKINNNKINIKPNITQQNRLKLITDVVNNFNEFTKKYPKQIVQKILDEKTDCYYNHYELNLEDLLYIIMNKLNKERSFYDE